MTDPTPPTLASLSLTDDASTPTPEEKPEDSAEESKSTASPPSGTSVGTQSPSTSPLQRPQPAQTNNEAPGTSSPAGRPQPLHVAASAPTVPSTNAVRPQPGARPGVARGMPAPMGMRAQAGRGAGGPHMQTKMLPSLQAKMDKIAASRQGPPPSSGMHDPNATSMGALLRSQALRAPGASQVPPGPGPASGPFGLAARRAAAGGPPRPNLGMMGMGASAPGAVGRGSGLSGRRGPPGGLTLSGMKGAIKDDGNKFSDFQGVMDPSGSLRFSKKAVLHAKGVDFDDGQSFKINMDEIEVLGELGKGNYGSVHKVFHRPTGVTMAMKEIRLELDDSKLNGIIMELDILHRAVAPEIVEFYGAFTIESCVYYCMEYMDAGSLDSLTGGGVQAKDQTKDEEEDAAIRVPEGVLRRITARIVKGLRFLKDELQIIHRDVKPTNVLINGKGEVKMCDFGVSGQLEKSLAKTNIGCQSYMAPERIKSETANQNPTYTVSSDVWSVGLSIVELAKGCYPYPPETYANVFAQLQAIVHGTPPTLPPGYSDDANDFVAKCLEKDPNRRPTYAQLLEHPFLLADKGAEVDMVGWVERALRRKAERGIASLNPIHPPIPLEP
ncbi:STE/STE7 protein kinase [Cryptococcus gattii E566]|uniref:mitogen-activated protein kinase kinase n=2 Tax=Cryptococcus gattii TaxID=37769 RepID=E6QYM2_CRYGW|nr:MAP kinase kinase, putative [Cryptococcus gattii WM276]ADV19917.1 MAP kinase kinase, putative [Cryptococcus gattii WM276]KIR79398.1 STE/STE7 protein kinase [Cryptococcus gattii EJB2]KIY37344.1 STE/STE7 protein kinase [Cryptococcus gattii E566]KJE02630.1 STE/STE7 protein kinase [Cryptococcus gattii NT-10]